MSVEDRDLVLQAAHGDVNDYAQLIGKYSNAVYAVAYSRLGDFHYAKDVSQIQLYHGQAQGDSQRDEFKRILHSPI
jgi:DNA-directed RNA polymerase specialized sigma24 family protein